MYNFSSLVVFSLLSLGMGYAVGNAKKFGILKFLFLLIFVVPSIFLVVRNEVYLVGMGGAFIFGFLYSQAFLFYDFFDGLVYFARIPQRRKQREYERQRQQQEDRYRAEQEQNQRSYESNRQQEEAKRRAEEARKQREEQAKKESKTEGKTESKAKTDKRTPEEILGLKPGFTQEQLKEAYRRESNRTHPDKWEGKPEHIRKLMEEEQKRINWAFEQLKKKF